MNGKINFMIISVFAYSSIFVSMLFLSDSWIVKKRRSILDYLMIFIITCIVQFVLSINMLSSCPFDTRMKSPIILTTEDKTKKKNHDDPLRIAHEIQLEKCWEKAEYHEMEAQRCFKQAEEACLWFPEKSDQEKAVMCFTTMITLLYPANPPQKVIGAIISAIAQYGMFVMNEWQFIDRKLTESKYHYEMQSHYLMLYNHQIDILNAMKKQK
jgi:hypothetical protein